MALRMNTGLHSESALPELSPGGKAEERRYTLDGQLPVISGRATTRLAELATPGEMMLRSMQLLAVGGVATIPLRVIFAAGMPGFALIFAAVFAVILLAMFADLLRHSSHHRRTLTRRSVQEQLSCWLALTGGPLDLAPADPCDGFTLLHANRETIAVDGEAMARFATSVVRFDAEQGWCYLADERALTTSAAHAQPITLEVNPFSRGRSVEPLRPPAIPPGHEYTAASLPVPEITEPPAASALIRAGLVEGFSDDDADVLDTLTFEVSPVDFSTLAEAWADYCAAVDKLNAARWLRVMDNQLAEQSRQELLSQQRENVQLLPLHRS